ncbi:hypothetical protein VTH8203_00280 [Vibrio thalassae]|uniref:Uncharacterized protein n=1 Tax=Vibrio thalassae TaxID=1243014 RepID=A0A240EBI4_9VIBR|nr:hypothetical protein [Vibrio thalassae]SNX45285.1 hypothetical protein VTH8203_00280 [Vibrio thalassae]
MNIEDFLIVAGFFTLVGLAIGIIAPSIFRTIAKLIVKFSKRPKHLRETKF